MTSGQSAKHLREQADLDRWLNVNAVFGAIFAVGLVAMAVIGSTQSGAIQQADTMVSTASSATMPGLAQAAY